MTDEFYSKPDIHYDQNQTNREVFANTTRNLIEDWSRYVLAFLEWNFTFSRFCFYLFCPPQTSQMSLVVISQLFILLVVGKRGSRGIIAYDPNLLFLGAGTGMDGKGETPIYGFVFNLGVHYLSISFGII